MISIYLDWSVISQMKQDSHKELLDIISDNEIFSIVYSTSHISDILVSNTGTEEQTKIISEDLSYLSNLTKNICAFIENKKVVIGEKDPNVLFSDRVWEDQQFNTDSLTDVMLKGAENNAEAYDLITKLLSSPIPSEIKEAVDNPLLDVEMKKMYPGLKENPTLENLINIGWKNYRSLMETDAYKDARSNLQGHLKLKPNSLIGKKPFQEIEKLYTNLYKQIEGIVKPEAIKYDDSPDWFQEITNNYLKLDLHGFHQDKIKVDLRNKDTMRNTLDDGFHSAFASTCNVFITNDNRAYMKSKEVYNEMGVDTKILYPNEFVTLYNESSSSKKFNPNQSHMETINLDFLIQSKMIISKIKSLSNDGEKINEIITYIDTTNSLLVQYGAIINSLLENQSKALSTLNNNIDGLQDLVDRIVNCETHLDTHDKHLSAHDDHLKTCDAYFETHDKYLSVHDDHLDTLSQRIDLL
jgi:hypothetical protein